MERAAALLRIGVLGDPGIELVEAVRLAVADVGQEIARDPAGADLLVLLLDRKSRAVVPVPPARSGRPAVPAIGALHTGADAARVASWATGHAALVRFDGPADLRWKLAQTLAGSMSGALREALRRQAALLDAESAIVQDALLALAGRRDPHAHRLARRVLPLLAQRRPEEATLIAARLAADGRPGCYALAATALRGLLRHDAAAARHVLGDLCAAQPAFMAWLLEQANR